MSQYELDYSFSEAYQSTLRNISGELRKQAEEIAFMHLHNPGVRLQFLRDIDQFIAKNEWEVKNACLSLSAGLDNIEDMRELLAQQHRAIQLREIKQYAYVEAVNNEKNGVTTLLLKQVGFVGGGMQVIAGYVSIPEKSPIHFQRSSSILICILRRSLCVKPDLLNIRLSPF
ncbi:DUF4225 domain-containing protein [Morganella morganii]|uniref:DUF4225 domain-containing protein n=1 Tax=Morganella morganii TaxID=582 RepID=UPI001BDB891A|nr:DUF4225 domain-containing protein [Morganella morganii]MBT0461228.1 DUF4225 domain-containing protein [Morganella morganii subsp. morganii]